jgi:uncharacterized protein (TIGR02145 family)
MHLSFKKITLLTLVLLAMPLFPHAQELRDAIGIRVMKNPEYLSPSTWYLENVPSPGKAKSTQIDGYEAVIDGRSVYVEATRVDKDPDNNSATNDGITEAYIYIMSYNEGGGIAIVNIFTQLLENWSFNSNIPSNDICDKVGANGDIVCTSDFDCIINNVDYGPCLSQKGKLRRDIKRVADLQDLKRELEQYALSNSSYPSLAQGTYIPRYSTSKWPSWSETLSNDLGIELPSDPLNRFYNDCSDLTGYHPDTCWNEEVKDFECNSGLIDPSNSSYLYVYSAKGVCSLHCDSLICFDGGNPTATTCSDNQDCETVGLTGPCGFERTCTQNSDCDAGEYCMKVNGVIDIQFNLETDKDTTISTSYPLYLDDIGATPGAGGVCSDSNFWAMTPVNFTDIDCCPPLDCGQMGLTGYTCGTYTNNCGESIDCGSCNVGETCINGSCCTPDCTGRTCGDDGCGGACGSCDIGYYCDSNYTCQEGCINECTAGSVRCNPNNEWTQQCSNCDLDSCNEWCDDTNCAINPSTPYCNDDSTSAICGECDDSDPPRQCGTNTGICNTGIETCTMGIWSTCLGGSVAGIETCNGLDDDCNGIIDDIPPGTLPFNNQLGVCNGYFQDCINGVPVDPTNVPDYENPETLCDYLDNDCDGLTDEAHGNLGDTCGTGVGECSASGVYVCNPSDPSGLAICSVTTPGIPQPEICDGTDNDCDGVIDNVPNWEAVETLCDGVDNDCDGLIDEDGICCVPDCTALIPFTPATFTMTEEWRWDGSGATNPAYNQVMTTPIVIDLNLDGTPEILFNTFTGNQYNSTHILRAIHGNNGSSYFDYNGTIGQQIATGDIDGDSYPEIIVVGAGYTLIALEHDGIYKWESEISSGVRRPIIADLDGDGIPEIIANALVLNNDGTTRWIGGGEVVANLDMLGRPEVLNGCRAYSYDGILLYDVCGTYPNGFVAVANLDDEPLPEIVTVSGGIIRVFENDFTFKWATAVPDVVAGGPPTIANFDTDPEPEIGVAGASVYVVLETDGLIKWTSPTIDASSRSTGSSVFDFNGDGQAEVLYNDEYNFRVYNGSDGTILSEISNGSGTLNEYPVIVDVDNDNEAEIVLAANDYNHGSNAGIRIFGNASTEFSWVDTRSIWNQYSYHITNVNDNGTIPATESNNWETYNNYRQNAMTGIPTGSGIKECGDDGCGGSCGVCLGGEVCGSDFMCQPGGPCTPTEATEVSCSDGIDNDCDGDVDENDSDCCVANFGDNCNLNNCGTPGGTIDCAGTCSGSAPPDVVLNDCTSTPNNCGDTNFVVATCANPSPACSAPADVVLDDCNLCSGFAPNGALCTGGTCDGGGNCIVALGPCAGDSNIVYGGEIYDLVEIGTQCWFRKNLNVGSMLISGATMPSDPAPTIGDSGTVEKWCYDNDDSPGGNCDNYGGLYTWAEANQLVSSCNSSICSPSTPNQGICPPGWHIPSDSDWKALVEFYGGAGCEPGTGWQCDPAGTQLKTVAPDRFSALLSGYRLIDNTFDTQDSNAYFWSSSENLSDFSWLRLLTISQPGIFRFGFNKNTGASVRCLKD